VSSSTEEFESWCQKNLPEFDAITVDHVYAAWQKDRAPSSEKSGAIIMSDIETSQEAFLKALSNAGISPEYQGDGVFTGQSRLFKMVFDAACEWQARAQDDEEPDLTWNSENNGHTWPAKDLQKISSEIADEIEPNSETVIKIICAKLLPERFLRVTFKDDGNEQSVEESWVSKPQKEKE
jgi:hypothetical protein